MSTLAPIDVVLITLYFVMVAAVGVGFCIKERRRAAARHNGDSSVDSSEDFFLAGRSQTWPAIGLSLFVSNIGSEHMLGLAGSAASGGIAVGWFEWSAGLHILVLGWLFAPIYHRSGIATLPEYVERRYNKRLRSCLSCASIALYSSPSSPFRSTRERPSSNRCLALIVDRSDRPRRPDGSVHRDGRPRGGDCDRRGPVSFSS